MPAFLLPRRRALRLAASAMLRAGVGAARAEDGRGSVVIGLSQEPTVFHPLLPHIEVDDGVQMNLFSALWFADAQGRFVPDLALAVPDSTNGGVTDGLSWNVTLRRDALWHDGRPVTAEDVAFTFDTLRDPAFPAFTRKGFELIESVTPTGPFSLAWRMKRPYAPMTAILAGTMIVPAHLLRGRSDYSAFLSSPVGSGPYRWGSRIPSEEIRLSVNPSWHGGKARIEQAIIRYIPDLTVLYTQLRTGEIDYLGMHGIPPDRYQDAIALQGRRIVKAPQPFIEGMALNVGRPQFRDQAVRTAIYEAIDKETMLETLYRGIERPTESFLPAESAYYDRTLPRHRFDPQAAGARLDAAGWKRRPGGIREKDGVRLEFVNATTTGDSLRQQTQEVIQENLADIGIRMRIENRPAAVMWGGYWTESQFDSALVSVDYMTGSDPDASSYFMSNASPARGGAGQNVFQFADPVIDSLFSTANASFDLSSRRRLFFEIQQRLREKLPVLPLYQVNNIEGFRAGLEGYESNVNVRSNLWNLARWFWR